MFLSRGLTILRHCKKFSACQKTFYSLNNNLTISSICISHPCIVQFPRCKSSKRNVKSLLPYRIANENCEEDSHSQDGKDNIETHLHDKFRVLLNPDKHADIINAGGTEAPADSKSLQVSVVGIPNAGKSTLVNQLIGSNICPHSQKVHTTRENTHGILTKDSIQVIFQVSLGH
jgi:predicted GTPase